jgi:hypothetical protein
MQLNQWRHFRTRQLRDDKRTVLGDIELEWVNSTITDAENAATDLVLELKDMIASSNSLICSSGFIEGVVTEADSPILLTGTQLAINKLVPKPPNHIILHKSEINQIGFGHHTPVSKIGLLGSFALAFAHSLLERVVLFLQCERLGATDLLIDSILTPIDVASIIQNIATNNRQWKYGTNQQTP